MSYDNQLALDRAYQNALNSQSSDSPRPRERSVDSEASKEGEKSISFSPMVDVTFIPTRKENSILNDDLYWKPQDYDSFKQDAMNEIQAYNRRTGLPTRQAITALYQPVYEGPLELALRTLNDVDSLHDIHPHQQIHVPKHGLRMLIRAPSNDAAEDGLFSRSLSGSGDQSPSDVPVLQHVDSLHCICLDHALMDSCSAETDNESDGSQEDKSAAMRDSADIDNDADSCTSEPAPELDAF
eukprot:gene2716-2966_t